MLPSRSPALQSTGDTALHECYSRGFKDLAKYLVSKGANREIRNNKGQTPRETKPTA